MNTRRFIPMALVMLALLASPSLAAQEILVSTPTGAAIQAAVNQLKPDGGVVRLTAAVPYVVACSIVGSEYRGIDIDMDGVKGAIIIQGLGGSHYNQTGGTVLKVSHASCRGIAVHAYEGFRRVEFRDFMIIADNTSNLSTGIFAAMDAWTPAELIVLRNVSVLNFWRNVTFKGVQSSILDNVDIRAGEITDSMGVVYDVGSNVGTIIGGRISGKNTGLFIRDTQGITAAGVNWQGPFGSVAIKAQGGSVGIDILGGHFEGYGTSQAPRAAVDTTGGSAVNCAGVYMSTDSTWGGCTVRW